MNKASVKTCLTCCALAASFARCGGGSEKSAGGGNDRMQATVAPSRADVAAATPTLNTFINASIEIDQLGSGVTPDDANLFVGPDPADGSASAQKPTGGPTPFIDWNDLGSDLANHRILDATTGKDPTSFPLSNECVGSSQVLSKMDLTYVAAANNSTYGYFAVQRANNNGDAGYYWLFTRKSPNLILGQAPCKPDQQRLLYDISKGDVLLGGHFHPNGTPLLRVFTATRDQAGTTAVDAVDFTSTLWSENVGGVAAVAVNTTPTAPGAFGSTGVIALTNGNLDPEIFAEAAVPISVFVPGGSLCGATFFGSVITRSSGSGGTSPDLKDLAGPALFNFGSPSATASLTATCGLTVNFQASGTGIDGKPIVNPTCSWVFDNNPSLTASTCSGSISLPAGTHTGTVTVSDPSAASCAASTTTQPITNFNPPAVTPSLGATCNNSFTYNATASGGTGSFSYAWTFAGGGTVSPSSSQTQSGSVAVGTGNVDYTGTVTITDTGRTDGLTCTDMKSAVVRPFSPLAISISPSATGLSCPGMTSDAVNFTATVSGGSGSNTITWTGNPALSCSPGANCLVDPSDSTFCFAQSLHATVTDGNALCGSKDSNSLTYSKVTSVSVTATP
jgi:hypothetical protein